MAGLARVSGENTASQPEAGWLVNRWWSHYDVLPVAASSRSPLQHIRALAAHLGHHDRPSLSASMRTCYPDAADRMRSVIDKAARVDADGPQTAREAGQ
jgi:hypothetical protein